MIIKILLAILSFCVAGFMLFEKIFKKEKQPTLFEYLVFFMILFTAGLTTYQIWTDTDTENERIRNENSNREMLDRKIQKGIDSGITTNNQILAEAFKKQNIDLDSLKKSLQFLKEDTNTKQTYNFPETIPDLDFSINDGIRYINRKSNEYEFQISFESRESKAKNVEIDLFAVLDNSKSEYLKVNRIYQFADGHIDVSKDVKLESSIKISVMANDSIRCLFLVAKGRYWNASLTHSYPLYSVRMYQMSTGGYFVLTPESYPNVWKFLEPK